MSPATPASHQEIPSVSETPTPAPAPWRIYLDQNAWIQLARQRLARPRTLSSPRRYSSSRSRPRPEKPASPQQCSLAERARQLTKRNSAPSTRRLPNSQPVSHMYLLDLESILPGLRVELGR